MTSISADTISDVISPEAVFIAACERNEQVQVAAHLQTPTTPSDSSPRSP